MKKKKKRKEEAHPAETVFYLNHYRPPQQFKLLYHNWYMKKLKKKF